MLTALTLTLTLACVPSIPSDRWAPFDDATFASPNGQYGVTIRRGPGVRFTLVERRAGDPPLQDAVLERGLPRDQRPESTRDAILLATGTLESVPYRVMVSDTGHGFAAVETHGRLGFGNAITTVNSAGKTINALPLSALYTPEEIEKLPRTTSSIWWFSDGWIDEASGELIVTAGRENPFTGRRSGQEMRVFAATFHRSGVRHGDERDLLRALQGQCERGAQIAIDYFCGADREDLRPHFVELFGRDHDTGTRLRAAKALARLGDLRGAPLVRRIAFHRDAGTQYPTCDRRRALALAFYVMGDDAIPLLIDELRRRPHLLRRAKVDALKACGQHALPHLAAVAGDPDAATEHKTLMAHIESSIQSTLQKTVQDGALPAKEGR